MNLLIISADFPPWDGGIAQVGYEYARAFKTLGHQVTVLAPVYGDEKAWDLKQPFQVLRYRCHKSFQGHFWLLRFQLARLLRRQAFDWILCMRWNLDGLALGARIQGNPVIFQWFHGNELFDRHLAKPKWSRRLADLMKRTDANIAVSDFTADLLARHYPACPRVQTVGLGIDSRRFKPPASVEQAKEALGWQGRRVVLSLARLVQRKGQELVIRSLPHLKDRKNILYVIAGKGAYEKNLRGLVVELGLEEQVRFAGFVPESKKVQYFQACDIYTMPSKSTAELGDVEGFGLTFLEANACGKPVIGGRQGGCVEAIADGISGLLVDPDNEVEMAAALERLLEDETFYSRLAQQGLERARLEFSWAGSCRRLLALYEDCISQKR